MYSATHNLGLEIHLLRLINQLLAQKEKHSIVLVIFLIILFGVSCGGEDLEINSNVSVQLGCEVDSCFLTVVDSIGVELGDSNYVFGAINNATVGPGGDIFVVDRIKCCIFRYSPDGEFIQQIGRRGSGPGEMLQPGFTAVMDDGSIAIYDGELGWQRYNSEGTSIGSRILLRPFPMQMMSADSSDILGVFSGLSRDENYLVTSKQICLWDADDPDEIVTEYCRKEYSIEIGGGSQLNWNDLIEIDFFPILFSAGDDFVCVAPEPRAEPILLLYDMEGSAMDTLLLPYPEVARTEEELFEQKQFVEELFYGMSQRQVEWEPFPNKPMITNLGVDSLNRIWVQRGFEQNPTFDLYDASGEHLKTAFLTGREDTDHWKFYISRNGILAVPEDPENYYSVYIIELQE